MAIFFYSSINTVQGQLEPMEIENDDLNLGGNDIFNDFKEDYEDTKVLEDEISINLQDFIMWPYRSHNV